MAVNLGTGGQPHDQSNHQSRRLRPHHQGPGRDRRGVHGRHRPHLLRLRGRAEDGRRSGHRVRRLRHLPEEAWRERLLPVRIPELPRPCLLPRHCGHRQVHGGGVQAGSAQGRSDHLRLIPNRKDPPEPFQPRGILVALLLPNRALPAPRPERRIFQDRIVRRRIGSRKMSPSRKGRIVHRQTDRSRSTRPSRSAALSPPRATVGSRGPSCHMGTSQSHKPDHASPGTPSRP